MKTVTLVTLILFVISHQAFAQNNKYIVKDDDDINKAIAPANRFRYPSFTTGHVVFKDGKESFAPLNYNWVLGEMQFINMKGDTLSLADEAMLKYIIVNKDSFFYDKVYLQLVDGNTFVKLAKNEKLKLGDVKKIGAFGLPTTASVTTYSSVNVNASNKELTPKQELTIHLATDYYIGDHYYHFMRVNKKNLLKMFNKKQDEIQAYLQENKISFNNSDDLQKLISFLKTLELE